METNGGKLKLVYITSLYPLVSHCQSSRILKYECCGAVRQCGFTQCREWQGYKVPLNNVSCSDELLLQVLVLMALCARWMIAQPLWPSAATFHEYQPAPCCCLTLLVRNASCSINWSECSHNAHCLNWIYIETFHWRQKLSHCWVSPQWAEPQEPQCFSWGLKRQIGKVIAREKLKYTTIQGSTKAFWRQLAFIKYPFILAWKSMTSEASCFVQPIVQTSIQFKKRKNKQSFNHNIWEIC